MHLANHNTSPSNSDTFPLITTATDGTVSFWNFNLNASTSSEHDDAATHTTRPVYTTKIHQNAVTCSQLMALPPKPPTSTANDAEYLLITGGDDNALAFTRFALPASIHTPTAEHDTIPPAITTTTLIMPRAHAAAVRSIAVVSPVFQDATPDAATLSVTITTASNDQTLRTWGITFDTAQPGWEGFDIRRRGKRFTPVADVSGVEVMSMGAGKDGAGDGCGNAGGEDDERGKRLVVCGVGMEVLRSGL